MNKEEVEFASKLYDEVFSGITNNQFKACVDIKKILPTKIRKTVRESMMNKNPINQLQEMAPLFLENDEKKLKKSSQQNLKKITDRNKMLEKHLETMDDEMIYEIQQFIKYLNSMLALFKLSQRRLIKALQYWLARSKANEKYKLQGLQLVQRTFIRFVQNEYPVGKTLQCYHLFSAWLMEAVEVWNKNNHSEFLKFIGFDYLRIRDHTKFPQQLTEEVHAMFKRCRYPPLRERKELMERYGIAPGVLGQRFVRLRQNIRKMEKEKCAQEIQDRIHEKIMKKEYRRIGKQIQWKKKKPPDEFDLIIHPKPIERLVTSDPFKKHFIKQENLIMVPLVRKLSDHDIFKVKQCLENHEKYYDGPWRFLWDDKSVKPENFIPRTFRRYENVLTKVELPKLEWNDIEHDKSKTAPVKNELKIKKIKKEEIRNDESMKCTKLKSCNDKSNVPNKQTTNQPSKPLVVKLPLFKTKKKERHKLKTEETISDKLLFNSLGHFECSMNSVPELNKMEIKTETSKIELKNEESDPETSMENLFQFNTLPNTSSNFLHPETVADIPSDSDSSETDATTDSDTEKSKVSFHALEVPDISQLFACSNVLK